MYAPLDLFHCIKPNMAQIRGFWGTKNPYSGISLKALKCINSTLNNFHCKSPEVIDSIIQNGYTSIQFTSYEADQKNYTSPFKRLFFQDYNILNSGSSIEYSFDLQPYKFQSDNGLIFPDEYSYESYNQKYRIFSKNQRSDNIVTFSFQGGQTANVFLRSYIKLQTVVTQIGGFVKAIMIIAQVIAMVISKNYFFSEILFTNAENEKNEKNSLYKTINNTLNQTEVPTNSNNMGNKLFNNFTHMQNKLSEKNVNRKQSVNSEKNEIALDDHLAPTLSYNEKNNLTKNLEKKKEVFKTIERNEKTLPDQSVLNILFNFLCSTLVFWRNPKYKNYNFKLLNSAGNIYRKITSVDTIMMKMFEVEFLKNNLNKDCMIGDKINLAKEENIKEFYDIIMIKTLKNGAEIVRKEKNYIFYFK